MEGEGDLSIGLEPPLHMNDPLAVGILICQNLGIYFQDREKYGLGPFSQQRRSVRDVFWALLPGPPPNAQEKRAVIARSAARTYHLFRRAAKRQAKGWTERKNQRCPFPSSTRTPPIQPWLAAVMFGFTSPRAAGCGAARFFASALEVLSKKADGSVGEQPSQEVSGWAHACPRGRSRVVS